MHIPRTSHFTFAGLRTATVHMHMHMSSFSVSLADSQSPEGASVRACVHVISLTQLVFFPEVRDLFA